MKWVIIIIAGLLGFIGLIALIGALLPKSHVASRSAKYNQPPEKIWDIITDFASIPSWRKNVKSMEKLPDRNGHPVWMETSNQGKMPYEVTEFEPPRRMVTQIADENLPFGGNWTYALTPTDGATILTITENGEIYNPIFRFMARFVFGYHATIENYLKALGEKIGEETIIMESPRG